MKKVRRCSDVPASSGSPSVQISLPILDKEETYKEIYGYSIVNPEEPVLSDIDAEFNDQPLEFNWNKNQKALEYKDQSHGDSFSAEMEYQPLVFEWTNSKRRCNCISSNNSNGDPKMSMKSRCCNCCETQMDKLSANKSPKDNNVEVGLEVKVGRKQCECSKIQISLNKVNCSCDRFAPEKLKEVNSYAGNVLNLPYSDSSSDEDS